MTDELQEFEIPHNATFPAVSMPMTNKFKIPTIVSFADPFLNSSPESSGRNQLELSIESARSLWALTLQGDRKHNHIDDPYLFGWWTEYVIDGRDVPMSHNPDGDVRVAIANFRKLKTDWDELLSRKCWDRAKTYPPAEVLAVMIRESLSEPEHDVIFMGSRVNHRNAISYIQKALNKGVSAISPVVLMFLASHMTLKLNKPVKREAQTPCQKRDSEFYRLFEAQGKSCKEIMALWNRSHSSENLVTESTVRQAISRFRKKM